MREMGFHAFFKEKDDMQASIDDKWWGWRKVLSSNQISILPNVSSLICMGVNAQPMTEMFLRKRWRCSYVDGFKFLAWGSIVA